MFLEWNAYLLVFTQQEGLKKELIIQHRPKDIPASSRSGTTMKYEASRAKRVRKL